MVYGRDGASILEPENNHEAKTQLFGSSSRGPRTASYRPRIRRRARTRANPRGHEIMPARLSRNDQQHQIFNEPRGKLSAGSSLTVVAGVRSRQQDNAIKPASEALLHFLRSMRIFHHRWNARDKTKRRNNMPLSTIQGGLQALPTFDASGFLEPVHPPLLRLQWLHSSVLGTTSLPEERLQ